jgi:predicted metal-dependent phosphoesterase TrpH
MIDLHVHSNHSDGILAPAELLHLAHRQGITLLALADHDAVSGIDEATVAGAALNITVIPAVELSVAFERYTDVHLLGYGINHHDPSFRDRLAAFCSRRDRRSEAIVERINLKLKRLRRTPIDAAEVAALANGAIGRPHIARVLMEHGHVDSMEQAFSQYLVPCNVAKEYFPLDEALHEIHRLGGIAVLAHPTSVTSDIMTLERIILRLLAIGLDGLEGYNNLASAQDIATLGSIARRHGLLLTGGSDYHGHATDERMGIVRDEMPIPQQIGDELVAALACRHQQKG